MQGWLYSSDDHLPESDLQELCDALAVKFHNLLGHRVFQLQRIDVAQLLEPYICDLSPDDQQTICWLVWHLFQDARDIMMQDNGR